jgi:hypothetical protein
MLFAAPLREQANAEQWSLGAAVQFGSVSQTNAQAAAMRPPPQMVNKVQLDQDIVVWVTTPSIQSTANAPVMPSSASATVPYASPPTAVLVTKPVRIPIISNHQGASIRSVSPQAR